MIKIKDLNFHSTFIFPYFTYSFYQKFNACVIHWSKKCKLHRVCIQGIVPSKFHPLVIENGTKIILCLSEATNQQSTKLLSSDY